ncbi:MAG: sigma-54-dependent Fis family transcriptional regulator [Gemmatimonadales bacterium]|nr:sigma-54-dependent Fis family transcriptional regulator [Gemmatimonadales bacterium]
MSRLLIVDDVPALAESYAYDLRRLAGHQVETVTNGPAALAALESGGVDCVLLDLEMPGIDGFEVLRELAHRGNETPVIVYTGTGDFDRCIQAVRLGAVGFIDKAEPMERVVLEVADAIERARLRREVVALQAQLGESSLRGRSAAMQALRDAIGRTAPVPSTVLILGESGTGKELVAREIHRLSPRALGPFVPINCAALPEHLIESELFGHEKGAFTGAVAARRGAFQMAGGGTLFLDEIGELPLPGQAKLLRVLEQREVMPLGASRTIPVDIRIVAATHRDLDAATRSGAFRDDLLYRLNVHTLQVPPLRERKEDIVSLAEQFVEEVCLRFGLLPKRLSGEVRDRLVRHDWRRNNVRELRNIIERIVVAAAGEVIRAEHLPPGLRDEVAESGTHRSYQEQKVDAERDIILSALERHDWQITRTADALGLADHASLLKIMRRLGISSPS